MKTLKTLILGLVAFGAAAIAPQAQADWHHHGSHHYHSYRSHGRVVIYDGPRYYYHRPYYYDYGYYGPVYYSRPYYYSEPSISIGFGGHSLWFNHHHYHHR